MSELESLADYWAATRPTIEHEYRLGMTDNYGSVVAEHIAQILHANGEEPSIANLNKCWFQKCTFDVIVKQHGR